MKYYRQRQFIAQVGKNDKIVGKIEKWEAHKKGILHRGFTAILSYKNQYIIQHRKHPVFDGVFDFSFSSHQIYRSDNRLQDDTQAVFDSLKREWNLEKKDLVTNPKLFNKIYYKAKDPNSAYIEHEIDYIYVVELKHLPSPNYNSAYGFSLVAKKGFLSSNFYCLTSNVFAPWVKVMIEEKLI